MTSQLLDALDELSSRRVVLFGGKGGVGKTTVSVAAALHYSASRPTLLFTTDPSSNLRDLRGDDTPIRVEELDARALYARFLETHLQAFLEIGDRGTYLDREELQRFFELSVPGIDELMAWMHIGELAEEHADSLIVVDTAPTGHTLRMLSSAEHFRQLALALDAMQEKHRTMVRQFTRRQVRDALDTFIDDFERRAAARRELLADPARAAFVPVTLEEPLALEQTVRLIGELELPVPFIVLNRARGAVAPALAGRRIVVAPRACVPLDSAARIARWSAGAADDGGAAVAARAGRRVREAAGIRPEERRRPVLFFAGKGGVGKTSCSASVALRLATRHPDRTFVAISVDPAHSLRELFASIEPPQNLTIETIDTKAKWRRFRDAFGARIEEAVDAITPRGMTMTHDAEAMRRLIEIAPPGADELFAITRLADLTNDESKTVIVDTAPTGHFLRLLDLPKEAGEWVREFMRILLRYKELIPAGHFGEELVRASRALKDLDATLRSERTGVIVVTRPERVVIAETKRLIADLATRGIRHQATIANYVTPAHGDACDRSMREHELAALETLDDPIVIERRERPPMTAGELLALVPVE